MSNDTSTPTIDPLEVTDDELAALGDAGKRALDRIRNAARENADKAARAADLEEKLAKYERQDALTEAELADLNEDQQEALLSTHQRKGRELTAEELRQTAVELGYASEAEGRDDVPAEEQDAHRKVASVAAADRAKQSTVLTREDVASWPQDKQRRFMKQHRSEWDALLRGETVAGVVFT